MKILFDEMYDGLDVKLQEHGFDVQEPEKLLVGEDKLGHDFNLIGYVKDHGMTPVSGDGEMGVLAKLMYSRAFSSISRKHLSKSSCRNEESREVQYQDRIA